MKILNLYAGIGGNRKLWGDEHEITAVEYKPEIAAIYQDFFPNDKVIVADAHEYLLKNYREFDFIWSSPPCISHSKARFPNSRGTGKWAERQPPMYPDLNLYQEIIFLDKWFDGKWCVENVMAYYPPLIRPIQFGNHWFWTNFLLPAFQGRTRGFDNKAGMKKNVEEKIGIDLSKYTSVEKIRLLKNCTEPELGKHILDWSQKDFSLNGKLGL